MEPWWLVLLRTCSATESQLHVGETLLTSDPIFLEPSRETEKHWRVEVNWRSLAWRTSQLHV